MADDHDLKSPEPIMRSSDNSGDCMYMFESGGSCYIWNRIEGDVWKVVDPVDLGTIFAKIGKTGFRSLKVELVPQVEASN